MTKSEHFCQSPQLSQLEKFSQHSSLKASGYLGQRDKHRPEVDLSLSPEVYLTLTVDLNSQTDGQDEAAHIEDEAKEDRVEGEGAHGDIVAGPQFPDRREIQETGMQEPQPFQREAQVLLQKSPDNGRLCDECRTVPTV